MSMLTPKQVIRTSFHAGAANTSMSSSFRSAELQVSFTETKSSKYVLEPFGLVQPLQVREVLKASRDYVETVQLHQSGWALLVSKTKIHLWRYVGKSQICKEFVVPSAEANGDHFNSELVCFYPAPPPVQTTPFPRHIGLVAVSSSGTAYSWSNVLQHDKAKGYADKQIVERGVAHSLHCIPEVGCLLATKDCRYYIITPSIQQGQSSIAVKQLSTAGLISGFARRFSSVWFQSGNEAIKVIRKVSISSFMDNKYVYILTDAKIEKWSIGQGHQQIYDVLLEPLIAERLPSQPDSDMLRVEYIDLRVTDDQLLILIYIVNPTRQVSDDEDMSRTNMATLATVVLSADTPSPRLLDIIIISSEVVYENDEDLLKWHLLDEECCHDNISILSKYGSHGDRLECRHDRIMGSGHCDKNILLFLAKAGVMRLQLKSVEASKYTPVVVKKAKKHSMRRSLLPQEMPTDDHLNVLKKSFQYYCEGSTDEAHLLLQQQFFPSFSQWRGQYQSSDSYGDIATVEISNLLLDDIPDADPRWAENQSQDSSNASTIILYQLEDKLIAHERLMQFFIDTGIRARLTCVTVHQRRLRTVDYLCEHAEKLVAAMTMKQLPNETFDGAIELVMESRRARGITMMPNLTLQDLFYREVSCVDDIFKALAEDENRKLQSLADSANRIRLVATVLSAYETILHEACQHRHSKYSFYHGTDVAEHDIEFIPWTATDHLRQLVTRQLNVVVSMGIQETTYEHKELLWQSFVALVDIILNGYCKQLESIRDVSMKKELNCVYGAERAKLLLMLTQIGLNNSVISLAEKFQDFPTIMSVCESNAEPRGSEMLHDYMIHFVNEGFPNFVFQKYKEQGRIKELMSVPEQCYQQLDEFLAPYEELRWMHEIHTKQFHSAYSTLSAYAANGGQQSLAKQKNFLSISKLSLLASSCALEEKQAALEELDLKLRLIDYQENLIRNFPKDDDVEDLQAPLLADQLIEYYTSDCFNNITAAMKLNNFLCALEILSVFYQDHHGDNFHHLQLIIASRAVLQNDWEHIPVEDALEVLKIVFFFQLAQAALDKELDVLQLLPDLQELLSCDVLCEVKQLPAFITIMNSGYEQLNRVTKQQ